MEPRKELYHERDNGKEWFEMFYIEWLGFGCINIPIEA